MGEEKRGNKWIRKASWLLAYPIIAILLTVLITAVIVGFSWHLVLDIFKLWWLMFLLLIFIVCALEALIIWRPKQILMTSLLIFTFVLFLASFQDNFIAEKMRSFLLAYFDTRFLFGAITFLSLALAFLALFNKRS